VSGTGKRLKSGYKKQRHWSLLFLRSSFRGIGKIREGAFLPAQDLSPEKVGFLRYYDLSSEPAPEK